MAITRAISTMAVDVEAVAPLPPPLYSQPFIAVVVIMPYNKIQFSVKMDSYFIFYLFPFFSLRFVIAAAADVAAFSGPFAFFVALFKPMFILDFFRNLFWWLIRSIQFDIFY